MSEVERWVPAVAAGYLCDPLGSCKEGKGWTYPSAGMVKPYAERRAKLEKMAKEALAKVAKMDRARKGQYTEGPSVKLWRVLTGKKMLAFIRKKWTAEQLAHMTARARGEEGMAPLRVNKPPAPGLPPFLSPAPTLRWQPLC